MYVSISLLSYRIFYIFSYRRPPCSRGSSRTIWRCSESCSSCCNFCSFQKVEEEDDDEEVDLFGSDSDSEDDAEKARVREERLAAYHAKKAKKPALIAKTSVVLDIKPWDDETDMDAMLKNVKTIVKEGLLWGACKFLFIYLMH